MTVRECVADQAKASFRMKPAAVKADDAGCFLAAMLKGMKPQRRDRGGVRMAEDAEDAAFLTQCVAIKIGSGSVSGEGAGAEIVKSRKRHVRHPRL
jgi:hypothetical protein